MADRCAEQGAVLAGDATRVGGLGLCDGKLVGHADKRVELRVELLDAGQQGARQFLGGEMLLGEVPGDLGKRQVVHVGILHHHSITRGTR